MKVSWFEQKAWRHPGYRKPHRWQPQGWHSYRMHCPGDITLYLTRGNRAGITLDGWGCRLQLLTENPRPVKRETLLKRRSVAAEGDGPRPKHLAPMETDFFSKLMALVESVATTAYDDGTARKPGWWTLRTVGSAYQIEVKDPDTASRLVVTGATLDDVLMLSDTLLRADEAPWEPDAWLRAKAPPKGPKKTS